MAKSLGIKRVKIHRFGGVLSAYGLSMADAVHEISEPAVEVYDGAISWTFREERLNRIAEKAIAALTAQSYDKNEIKTERYLNMRFQGTDNAIMIMGSEDKDKMYPYDASFRTQFQREYGFELKGRDIIIDDYRVRAIVPGRNPYESKVSATIGNPETFMKHQVFFENGWEEVSVFISDNLQPGHVIIGPALIIQPISTVVIEIGCTARITSCGDLDITVLSSSPTNAERKTSSNELFCIKEDPVMLSIFGHRFMGVAEQMGKTLARTSVSVNIKERLDFSCALFTKEGGLVANAPHIPVHLGAMQEAVTFQVKYWNENGREGIQEGNNALFKDVNPVFFSSLF
jgi:5-oxoprolinase (ATP-hydrolysing)